VTIERVKLASTMASSVLVVGLGSIGSLVADLLAGDGYRVVGLDADGATPSMTEVEVVRAEVSSPTDLAAHLAAAEVVVSCLPHHLNIAVARAACAQGVHYLDLTEDRATTRDVKALATGAEAALIPHCGLAPGYVCIVAADLARSFSELRALRLRVGALPQTPSGRLAYAVNWSAAGVINEYLNDCDVIRNGKRGQTPALTDVEHLVLEGVPLEAFATSGGLGTLCDTFEGRCQELNYKTLRYPGHRDAMEFLLHEVGLRKQRHLAEALLRQGSPPTPDDVVYVSVGADGLIDGAQRSRQFLRSYRPRVINGLHRTAISWTTAASTCAVVELLLSGAIPSRGLVKQEEIPLEPFSETSFGRLLADSAPGLAGVGDPHAREARSIAGRPSS
jgi:saccharopine dehydrogenase-like NADP-dependent oxidoreductase